MKATFQSTLDRWIGDRTYEDVAPLLGAAFGTIHAWRHGESVPANSRIPSLAIVLGVTEAKLRKIIARDRAQREHAADAASAAPEATATIPHAPVTP